MICVPVLEKESKDQNKTLEEHMAHLLVHGTLHAQGYDHMDDEEAEVMEQRETDVFLIWALMFRILIETTLLSRWLRSINLEKSVLRNGGQQD